jgi:ABC-type transport system substrate-binding protein
MFEYFNMLDHVSMEGPDAQKTLIGTGPFTFLEWAQGDHLTFAKNANYWRGRVSARSVVQGLITSQHNALIYNDASIVGGA